MTKHSSYAEDNTEEQKDEAIEEFYFIINSRTNTGKKITRKEARVIVQERYNISERTFYYAKKRHSAKHRKTLQKT